MIRQTPRWRWVVHFIIIGAWPALGLFFRATARRLPEGPALSGNVRGLLLVSALELSFFFIYFAAAWLISRASREQLMLRWRPGWWVVPLGLGYSIALRRGLIVICHEASWPAVIAHGFFDATTLALLPWLTEKARHLH